MSRQQSDMPDEAEVASRGKRSQRATPWIVWMYLPRGRGRPGKWFRKSKCATKERAEQSAVASSQHFKCVVRHVNDGKPQQPPASD